MKYEFEPKLKELIRNYSQSEVPCVIDDDTDLVNVLGYNSINLIQLIVAIEKQLGVELNDYSLNADSIFVYKYLREYVYKLSVVQ